MTKPNPNIIIFSLVALLVLMMFYTKRIQTDYASPQVREIIRYRTITPTPDTIYREIVVSKPISIIQTDTVNRLVPDSLLRFAFDSLANEYDSLNKRRIYTNPIDDSLITGTITSEARGQLLRQELKYKIKPIQVSDTTRIIHEKQYGSVYAIASINSNVTGSIGLGVDVDGILAMAQYNPFVKTLTAGVGIRLFKFRQR